jgi:hypothetical protein
MKVKALFGRAFQVALSSATNLVARNQMQPVTMYALFVGEQQFSGCTLCEKIPSFIVRLRLRFFLKIGV